MDRYQPTMELYSRLRDPEQEAEGVDLRAVVLHLWRRRNVAIRAAVAGACFAFLVSSLTTPRYEARASVMLDAQSVQVLSSDNLLSDLTLNNSLLDSEAAVLRSNVLLERVISVLDPAGLALIDPGSSTGGWFSWLSGSAGEQNAAATDSAAVQEEQKRMRRLVNVLRRGITVAREGQSYVISVAVETVNPVMSMQIANTLVNEYISSEIEQRSVAMQGASQFLSDRVKEMRGQVEVAERAVEEFKVGQLALDGMSAETMAQQLLDLGTQLALSRADLASTLAKSSQIETVIAQNGITSAAELLSSPYVLSLRERLSEIEREDADLATQLGPEHPDRQRLRASSQQVTDDLADEVRKIVATLNNDASVAQIRVTSLQDSVSELENRVADVSRASLELRQLEREATAVRDAYEVMLARLNETQALEQFHLADARLVERAVQPTAHSAPRVRLMTALGGAAGLSIGLVALFLLEMTMVGFSRKVDLERATGQPVIGMLPRGPWKTPQQMLLSITDNPNQAFSEQIRNLRTTLTLRHNEKPPQTVLFTSAVPGEGKTLTSVAYANVEAQAGKSVVLVDFDARKSRLDSELGYVTGAGDLSAYLRGVCTLDEALQRPNGLRFSLITTLRADPRLVDDASGGPIKALFEALRARFDVIVIDSPPLLVVSDTLLISRHADAVLMLVKQGTTRRQAVRDALRRLEDNSGRPDGLVMTVVDPHELDESYGGKGYYDLRA